MVNGASGRVATAAAPERQLRQEEGEPMGPYVLGFDRGQRVFPHSSLGAGRRREVSANRDLADPPCSSPASCLTGVPLDGRAGGLETRARSGAPSQPYAVSDDDSVIVDKSLIDSSSGSGRAFRGTFARKREPRP